jgi:hypothetical protein
VLDDINCKFLHRRFGDGGKYFMLMTQEVPQEIVASHTMFIGN